MSDEVRKDEDEVEGHVRHGGGHGMTDESDVEGHVRHGGGHGINDEPETDDEVEAHVRKAQPRHI